MEFMLLLAMLAPSTMPACRAEPPLQEAVSYVVQSRSVAKPGESGTGGSGGGGGLGAGGALIVLATPGFATSRAEAEDTRSIARRSIFTIVATEKTRGLSVGG